MKLRLTAMIMVAALVATAAVAAPATNSREAFLRQQAMAEMNRVSGQIDSLQKNFDDLERRVAALERGGGENAALRSEIQSLRSQIAELKKQMEAQRGEIINDLSGKIVKMQQAQARQDTGAAGKSTRSPAVVAGPHLEYTVQPGDSLFLIAKAFNTTVGKIKAMNPRLNPNNLKVGMKINVPKE